MSLAFVSEMMYDSLTGVNDFRTRSPRAMHDRDLDLLDPETHAGNPWQLYEWLREEAPRYYDSINKVWCFSRYDDIVAVARDPKTFTSMEGNRPGLPYDGSFIHLDGKKHTERRGLIFQRFGPKAIRKLEDHIRAVVVDLLDEMEPGSDFVESVAAKLPMRIIAEMCGVPVEHHDTVRHYLDTFCLGGNGPKHVTEEVNEAFYGWAAIHFELAMERQLEPKDDLLSIWVQADDLKHAPFDEENLLFEHTMLIVGGSETTRNVITGGLYELIQRPEDLAWLREHPEGIGNAVEEMLRWVTPFVSMSRTATKDVDFDGTAIKDGDEVMMLYPAANRQPDKFPEPYTFDIRRNFDTPSLSFGYGKHFCIGARLARTELRILFEEVLKRWDHLELPAEPTWARSSFIRGITEMPLRFEVRADQAAMASK